MDETHSRRTVLKTLAAGVAGVAAVGRAGATTQFEDELRRVERATEQ